MICEKLRSTALDANKTGISFSNFAQKNEIWLCTSQWTTFKKNKVNSNSELCDSEKQAMLLFFCILTKNNKIITKFGRTDSLSDKEMNI